MKWRNATFMDDMRSASDIQDADFTNQRVARQPIEFWADVTDGNVTFYVRDGFSARDRKAISAYRVYFVPRVISLGSGINTTKEREAAYKIAKFVCDIPTTGDTELLQAVCNTFYGAAGWYYCVSVNNSGTEGLPTTFITPVSAGPSSTVSNGSGGLRERLILHKYAKTETQRSGSTYVDCLTDGTYNGSVLVPQSVLASAGPGYRMRATLRAQNVAYIDGAPSYNIVNYRLTIGSTNIITITHNNNVTTGQTFTLDLVCDLQFQSVSGTNTSVMGFMVVQGAQSGPSTGAFSYQQYATINVPNTAPLSIALSHRAQNGSSSASYYWWYNHQGYLWQIL